VTPDQTTMGKRLIAPIVGRHVRLRLLEEVDLPTTLAWRNQDSIRRWFFHSDLISPQQHHDWFEQYRERDDDFVFIIEEVHVLKRPVGQVAIYQIDWQKRTGEFGRLMIGDEEAGRRGLASEATKLLVDSALESWGLDEVFLETFADNIAAVSVYKRCGFGLSGVKGRVLLYSKRSG